MATLYIKLDIEFELFNDPDPERDSICQRYSPGWNDGVSLCLKTEYVIPYGISISKEDLVDGELDVIVKQDHLQVKCVGVFKTKLDKTPIEAIEAGGTTWHLSGIPYLYGRLGKVKSNGILRFDPTSVAESENPSTYQYQKGGLTEEEVVLGPEVDVLAAKTKSALKS